MGIRDRIRNRKAAVRKRNKQIKKKNEKLRKKYEKENWLEWCPITQKLVKHSQLKENRQKKLEELFGDPSDIDFEAEFDKLVSDHKKYIRKQLRKRKT